MIGRWLFECARTGVKVPEEMFALVVNNQSNDATVDERNQSMKKLTGRDVANKENIKTPKNNDVSSSYNRLNSTPRSINTSTNISKKLTTPQETKSTTKVTSTPTETTPKQSTHSNDAFKTPLTFNTTSKSASSAPEISKMSKHFSGIDSRRKSLRNTRVNVIIILVFL